MNCQYPTCTGFSDGPESHDAAFCDAHAPLTPGELTTLSGLLMVMEDFPLTQRQTVRLHNLAYRAVKQLRLPLLLAGVPL